MCILFYNQLTKTSLQIDGSYQDQAVLAYDAGGRETKRTFGNGVVSNRSFGRDDNLVTAMTASGIIDFDYSYDANKRKTRETDNLFMQLSQDFSYDNEDRLVAWDRSDPSDLYPLPSDRDWELSAVGDWDVLYVDGIRERRNHNAVHELTKRRFDDKPNKTQSHDAKGNMTDSGYQQYQWDYENRMTTATGLADGHSATYRYDALGRRVQKSVTDSSSNTQITTYALMGAQVVAEYETGSTGNGDPARIFLYASYVDDPVVMFTDTNSDAVDEPFYYHSNHLYSVAAITDSAGTVIERYGYDAYGARVILNGTSTTELAASTIGQPYGFTGRRYDDETGLWYFRARYFDDEIGRFISRDPLRYIDDYNFYCAYFVPNSRDPLGLYALLFKSKKEPSDRRAKGAWRRRNGVFARLPYKVTRMCVGNSAIVRFEPGELEVLPNMVPPTVSIDTPGIDSGGKKHGGGSLEVGAGVEMGGEVLLTLDGTEARAHIPNCPEGEQGTKVCLHVEYTVKIKLTFSIAIGVGPVGREWELIDDLIVEDTAKGGPHCITCCCKKDTGDSSGSSGQ